MRRIRMCQFFRCMAALLAFTFLSASSARANLLTDGGFESSTLGWTTLNPSSGSVAYDTSVFQEGTRSRRLTPTSSVYPNILTLSQYYTTLSGQYFFEGYARVDNLYNSAAYRPRVAVSIYPTTPGAFTPTFENFSMPQDAPRNSWIKLSGVINIPANSTVYFQLYAFGDTSGGSPGNAWFDGLNLLKYSADDSPRRKVIQYGFGAPDTQYVRAHWQDMEKLPLDGTCISVAIDRDGPIVGDGNTANMLGRQLFSDNTFQLSQFEDAIDDLNSANFKNMTDNFLTVAVASDANGSLSWFNNTRWNKIINNWQVMATIARDGGCKGFFFDPEDYYPAVFNGNLFDLDEHDAIETSYNATQIKAQAKLRGKQLMEAAGQIYPKMTVFCTYAYYLAESDPGTYGLLGSFLDGMLEGSTTTTKFVDGWEPAYGYTTDNQFVDARSDTDSLRDDIEDIKNYHCGVLTEYSKRMKVGFGLFLDNERHWSTTNFNNNYFTPAEFKQSLIYALNRTDEYVWIYNEKPLFFPQEDEEIPDSSPIPLDYLNAIRDGRYESGATRSLIRNGGFENSPLLWDVVNPTRGSAYIHNVGMIGSKCLALNPSNSISPNYHFYQQSNNSAKGRYFFEGYLRIDSSYNGASKPGINVNIYPLTAGDFSPIFLTFAMPSGTPVDTWVRVGGPVDVPPNSVVWAQIVSAGTAGTAYIDALSLQ